MTNILPAFILALLILARPFPAMAEGKVLRVNTSIKPPYSTQEENGALDLILRELFNRIGYEITFVRLPPERALHMVDEGKSDAEAPRIKGLQHTYGNLVVVPEPIVDYHFVSLTCMPGVKVDTWEDLGDMLVSYIIGWKIYETNVPIRTDVTRASSPTQLLQLVAYRRVQVGLYERHAARYLARELNIGCLREAGPPLASRPMYLYLNRKHSALVGKLTGALKAMKRDGVYNQILRSTLGQ